MGAIRGPGLGGRARFWAFSASFGPGPALSPPRLARLWLGLPQTVLRLTGTTSRGGQCPSPGLSQGWQSLQGSRRPSPSPPVQRGRKGIAPLGQGVWGPPQKGGLQELVPSAATLLELRRESVPTTKEPPCQTLGARLVLGAEPSPRWHRGDGPGAGSCPLLPALFSRLPLPLCTLFPQVRTPRAATPPARVPNTRGVRALVFLGLSSAVPHPRPPPGSVRLPWEASHSFPQVVISSPPAKSAPAAIIQQPSVHRGWCAPPPGRAAPKSAGRKECDGPGYRAWLPRCQGDLLRGSERGSAPLR
ncbi:uncharacterized protein LOC103106824 [Monodelphis domestica]|uniref:uncharacterized protein LOC103106824 n=1 Tax=Monodelphis domestica TaxID=13616 RepID=UPI00044314D4|nr:uncharacterized protein LOC103106824 [Monodelphis domestica]